MFIRDGWSLLILFWGFCRVTGDRPDEWHCSFSKGVFLVGANPVKCEQTTYIVARGRTYVELSPTSYKGGEGIESKLSFCKKLNNVCSSPPSLCCPGLETSPRVCISSWVDFLLLWSSQRQRLTRYFFEILSPPSPNIGHIWNYDLARSCFLLETPALLESART